MKDSYALRKLRTRFVAEDMASPQFDLLAGGTDEMAVPSAAEVRRWGDRREVCPVERAIMRLDRRHAP